METRFVGSDAEMDVDRESLNPEIEANEREILIL